jgi:type I restriction enzyme M protein
MTAQNLSSLVKRASDKMRADDNTKGATKYLEHFSWLLFLKAFEAVEDEQALIAEVDGRHYERVIDGQYRWSKWADGSRTGAELVSFISDELLPHLRSLAGNPLSEEVAQVFSGVTTVMRSGYVLAEVIDVIDDVDFHSAEDYHAMSVIYETLLAEMGREAGWSGEFYTPRPIIELVVRIVDPRLGERVYDPCAGSCGFLVSAYSHMGEHASTVDQWDQLQHASLYGQEAGELPYLLGVMNLMLHGIRTPNVIRANTLERDVRSIQPEEQYQVTMTNPPFGGKENPQVQQNFPVPTAATEMLFLQHIMATLKPRGRAGVVVPEGVLFRRDAFASVKARLLAEFNLHTVVSLPEGVFAPYSEVKTNLLFFDRVGSTEQVFYTEVLSPGGRRFTKTRPIRWEHLVETYERVRARVATEHSWFVSAAEIAARNFDLTARNPRSVDPDEPRTAADLAAALVGHRTELNASLDVLERYARS